MTRWWSGRAVVFDTESDAKDPAEAHLVQAAAGLIRPGAAAEVSTWIVHPDREIPQQAIDVHHITNERARAEGLDREMVLRDLVGALLEAGDSSNVQTPVICHNAPYDLTLLDRELRRAKLGSLGFETGAGASGAVFVRMDGRTVGWFYVIDTLLLDKQLDRFRKGPPEGGRNKLEEACQVYGVPMPEGAAHAADADALAAGRLAWAIARRCAMGVDAMREPWKTAAPLYDSALGKLYADRKYPPEIVRTFAAAGELDLPTLHAKQQQWAAEQAEQFREHCLENPEYAKAKEIDVDGIDGSWPFRPYV